MTKSQKDRLVKRLLIKLNIFASFCQLAGGDASSVNVKELWEMCVSELKREGITDEPEIMSVMQKVSDQL